MKPLGVKILHSVAAAMLCMVAPVAFNSCGHEDEPVVPVPGKENRHTLLVYAVASNNLWFDYKNDQAEMLAGLKDVDLDKYSLLVYRVAPLTVQNPATSQIYDTELLKAVRGDKGELTLKTIKTYNRKVFSTDPARLGEVVDDMQSFAPASSYGLMLWSHGLGWLPKSETARPRYNSAMYSFGQDDGPTGIDRMDIDELADALPDNLFDYIWFDACYMSGIETIYELRDKCSTMVAYPTEIWSEGMPYQYVLPYIMMESPMLTTAAAKVFDYFESRNAASTIAVIDMSHIEELADAVRDIYSMSDASEMKATDGLQYYSRSVGYPFYHQYPFYDLGQYTATLASKLPAEYGDNLKRTLSDAVRYKAISKRSFENKPFNSEVYSGISTHVMQYDGSAAEAFYTTLDWYGRVY